MIRQWFVLAALVLSSHAGPRYSLELTETVREEWRKDFEARLIIRSNGEIEIRDNVSGKQHRVGKEGVVLASDEQHARKFCIENGPCREAMVVDFSYDGLQEALLGGRGEQLRYIVLAECLLSEKDRDCRWPHKKLGAAPILKLLEMGLRPRVRFLEDRRRIVVGPFTEEERIKQLKKLRRTIPEAFTCEGEKGTAEGGE